MFVAGGLSGPQGQIFRNITPHDPSRTVPPWGMSGTTIPSKQIRLTRGWGISPVGQWWRP